jgi:ABC-type sulfate transport system substrate-binding protein
MEIQMNEKIVKVLATIIISVSGFSLSAKDFTLLNVSYDPTRELYAEYNKVFANYWKGKTGDEIKVNQSHGGSGKQEESSASEAIGCVRRRVLGLAHRRDASRRAVGARRSNRSTDFEAQRKRTARRRRAASRRVFHQAQ